MYLRTNIFTLAVICSASLAAQTGAGPDVIIFNNGEKLAGHFVRSTGANVTFKSDALGDLTIDWNKVRELQTTTKVAVIRKGVHLARRKDTSNVPQGTLAMKDQNLVLTPTPAAAPQPIPVGQTEVVVDQPAFDKAINSHPGLLQDWKGTVTLGASLVTATQNNETFNAAVGFVRAVPAENWIPPRNRTAVDFSTSFGEISQPHTPTVKSSIYHAAGEQDEYVNHRLFVFAQGAFDHNYSQGLSLQQTYSGGLGWTVIEGATQTLDLKVSGSYIRQQFSAGPNQSLEGSVFAQHYNKRFKRGFVADEHVTYIPAWNNTNAWTANFGTVFTMPVYKRISASSSIVDSFLNDPPPGFKKNSFQFALGATLSLQ
jgi:hypothetical protein